MKILNSAFLGILTSVGTVLGQDDPWSYIVLADWHGTELFSLLNNSVAEKVETYVASRRVFKDIKDKYGGDLMILPGDTQSGHWDTKWYRKKFLWYNPELPEAITTNEIISLAADNCYSTAKKLLKESGFDTTLFAVGDHEIGGNAWRMGSRKVNGLPYFREHLVQHLNRDENGSFLFNEKIGNADSRPFNTPYASTSYAYVHKNALFITLDAFHQVFADGQPYFNKELSSGGEGMITCTVTGDHLVWFENVLKEANKDASVKHIFVQAHVPILQPVRKIFCSGQFLDQAKESEFWKAMQTYGVDVYFAGEVHSNTVSKDDSTDLIQVVSRGNSINNFISVDVNEDKFTLSSYNEVGPDRRWNGNYTKYGEIIVDKSGESTSIESSGSLKILDIKSSPLIEFSFEEGDMYELHTRQVVGMKHNQFKESLIGKDITIRNQISSTGMENYGSFGQQYDAQVANLNIDSNNALYGKGSGIFTDETRVAINSMGPMGQGERISCSLFFQTTKSKEMILVHFGGAFDVKEEKDVFLLTIKDGKPILRFSKTKALTAVIGKGLNDGVWHQLSVSMPTKSCLGSEVVIKVDGMKVDTALSGNDEPIFYNTSGNLSLGGWGYSLEKFESEYPDVSNFLGKMDSFFLWSNRGPGSKALKRNFDINYDANCLYSESRVKKGRWKGGTCKRKCLRSSTCWGYEMRDKDDNKKFQCYHFVGERPVVDDTTVINGNQCNPVV